MRIRYDLTREDIARLTSKLTEKERYELGMGSVLDGAVWPGMVGSSDHVRLVSEVYRLRLVTVPDELALRIRITTDSESLETLEDQALHARAGIVEDNPRILDYIVNIAREALVLKLTVMPAVLVRLGLGDQGIQHFKRAVADRAQRWVLQERQRRKGLRREGRAPGPLPKGLDMKPQTQKAWRSLPSFESAELRGTMERGLVPVAMARVQSLLQETLPAPLTLREIYDHALEHWPVALHSMELLRRACDMLVMSYLAAETRVPGERRSPNVPNWIKAYKSIKLEMSYPDVTPHYIKSLTEFVGEVLQCLAEPEPEEPPFIETMRYLIPRDELSAFKALMLHLREEARLGGNQKEDAPPSGGVPSIGAIFTTIHRLPVNI